MMLRRRLIFVLPVCLFLLCCAAIYLTLQSVETTPDTVVKRPRFDNNDNDAQKKDIPAMSQRPAMDRKAHDGHKQNNTNGTFNGLNPPPQRATNGIQLKPTVDKQSSADQQSSPPKIPHIIHQIWNTRDIPTYLEYWVKSWRQKNPEWQYWLWTLEDGLELVKRAFPSYLVLYESYTEDIFRIDALRLFVLYAFGGVYVDIDMFSLKPLDPWTYEHECILTQETYEHSFIVEEKNKTNVVNGFLACRPHHPFFRLAIQTLTTSARNYFGDFLHATGPFFVDHIYRKYNASVHSKEDSLTVVKPKYFLPTFDPTQEGVISYKCAPSRYKQLPPEGQEICKALWRRDYKNNVDPESFTDHKWLHLYMYDPSWKLKNTKPLLELVPQAHDIHDTLKTIEVPLLSG